MRSDEVRHVVLIENLMNELIFYGAVLFFRHVNTGVKTAPVGLRSRAS